MSEDAGIGPMTVAILALAVKDDPRSFITRSIGFGIVENTVTELVLTPSPPLKRQCEGVVCDYISGTVCVASKRIFTNSRN